MVFESGNNVGSRTKEPMHLGVERLEVAGVDDRHIEAIGAQLLCGLAGEREHGPESEQGHLYRTGLVLELRVYLGLADFDHGGLVLNGHTLGVAARVANSHRMRLQGGGEHHVLKFILVGRSHADDQRQAAQVGDVEQPVVGRTVVGAQAGAVHAEDHRQVLETDIVMDAVIGPLEEGAVNGHHRMETHGRHAGGKDDRVFFSDADVVILARHCLLQYFKASAAGHSRGNANDRFVLLAQLDHRATEDFLPHRSCPVLRGRGLTSGCVVGAQPVEFLRVLQRRFVALALLGQHMDDHGLTASLSEL